MSIVRPRYIPRRRGWEGPEGDTEADYAPYPEPDEGELADRAADLWERSNAERSDW